MSSNQKAILVFLSLFTAAGILITCFFPKEEPFADEAVIRIGAGNDISGVLMREIADELSGSYELHNTLDTNAFVDCCSNSAQWALNAEEINLAFFCSHIANSTVQKNDKVMIYAPVIMNAELLVYPRDREFEGIRKVGITQGRVQEMNLARKTYPGLQLFYQISQKGILYALEDGQVDADILDLVSAARNPSYQWKPLSSHDYISYVLVVDKEFAKTDAFSDFVDAYNRAAETLSDPEILAERIGADASWLSDKPLKLLTLDK